MNIFATDIDNTFLVHGEEPSDKSVEAVKLLLENEYELVAVSGRVASSIRNVMDKLNIKPYIIGTNGAIILDPEDNIIYKNPLPKSTLKKLIEIAKKHNLDFQMYSEDTYYSNRIDTSKIKHMHLGEGKYCVDLVISNNLEDYILNNEVDIYKFFMYISYEDNKELHNELKTLDDIYIVLSGDKSMDIMAKNVSKGHALEKLTTILGVKKEDTVAIGDHENDIDMIQYAGTGIAMGNAIESLKEASDYITDDVKNDGFYKAVVKTVINKMRIDMKGELC